MFGKRKKLKHTERSKKKKKNAKRREKERKLRERMCTHSP
jgi:hypothetical protein